MRIIQEIKSYQPDPDVPLILILGNFDGIHAGHRALIARGLQEARRCGGKTAVFTFHQHPQSVLHPSEGPKLLTSLEQKLSLLASLGIDICFLLPFTQEFAQTSPEAFVREILVEQLKVHEVCLGHNARFGHNRTGDVAKMKELSEEYLFRFQEMFPVSIDGEVVSSSRVRQLIEHGNFEKAHQFLQRRFGFFGEVVKGDGRGREIGFPTANLSSCNVGLLRLGVYAVKVRLVQTTRLDLEPGIQDWQFSADQKWQEAVLNYGKRPTFKGEDASEVAEVHLLDFEGDLSGKALEIEVYQYLRPERPFENAQALKSQILKDIEDTRFIFQGGSEAGSPSLPE